MVHSLKIADSTHKITALERASRGLSAIAELLVGFVSDVVVTGAVSNQNKSVTCCSVQREEAYITRNVAVGVYRSPVNVIARCNASVIHIQSQCRPTCK